MANFNKRKESLLAEPNDKTSNKRSSFENTLDSMGALKSQIVQELAEQRQSYSITDIRPEVTEVVIDEQSPTMDTQLLEKGNLEGPSSIHDDNAI